MLRQWERIRIAMTEFWDEKHILATFADDWMSID